MKHELMLPKEVARYLRISEEEALCLQYDPSFNYVNFNGRILFPRRQVEKYVRAHMDSANPNKDL